MRYRKDNNKNPFFHVKNKIIANDFPDIADALENPNGLLAIGGNLNEARLLSAYKKGIFPWYNEGEPIMWWSPNPRCILKPKKIHVSRSLKKCLRKKEFQITFNKNFTDVINQCSLRKKKTSSSITSNDTWITVEIKNAFINLHKLGYAHSVECWFNKQLVGGLYGIAMGKIFFGESMFSLVPNASKISLVYLAKCLQEMKFQLIDCQVKSDHLLTLGAKLIRRKKFSKILDNHCDYNKTVLRYKKNENNYETS